MTRVLDEAIRRVEEGGIVFIDEIDKIAGPAATRPRRLRRGRAARPAADRRGHDRRHHGYGPVKTDHVLFIGAGAFTARKPSDLLPEFQGASRMRVELDPLGEDEFLAILTEPENSLSSSTPRCWRPRSHPHLRRGRPARDRRDGRRSSTSARKTSARAGLATILEQTLEEDLL